jgi:RNA-directed DNA polymerase
VEGKAVSHRKTTEALAQEEETPPPPSEDWAQTPWRTLEKHVYRLQKRIYRASARGNHEVVHSLQRLLLKSRAARTLAVRRVTQDNQGKRTAGIDGVKSVAPVARMLLVHRLRDLHTITPQPTRRVWIPKPGTEEQRPLGIPTMLDRAHQILVKLALEPEWEARFEPHSDGFRPGRSVHDAIGAIFNGICHQPKYVLDADIAGCFNTIAHAPLLAKLQTFPLLRRTIKAWLKAGVLEDGVFAPTAAGTPQGGCISPLLANVALHGMERAVQEGYAPGRHMTRPILVRYADDLVVLFPTREGIEQAHGVLQHWLAEMGLELKPSKTRICHTLDPVAEYPAGFDFLGFNVRQFRVGASHSGRSHGKRLGFKTLIRPSTAAVKRHRQALHRLVVKSQGLTQEALIGQLNPRIRGWSNYYRHVVSKRVFNDCDYQLFPVLLRWATRRHPRKSATWRVRRYWRTINEDHWRFATAEGVRLAKHAAIPIRRHVLVQSAASPYDGNLLYWARRLQHQHPLTRDSTLGKLLTRQQGKCGYCGLYFLDEAPIEIDHRIPRSLGGDDQLSNLMALHRHCHDQRHAAWQVGGGPDIDPSSRGAACRETGTSRSEGGQERAISLA